MSTGPVWCQLNTNEEKNQHRDLTYPREHKWEFRSYCCANTVMSVLQVRFTLQRTIAAFRWISRLNWKQPCVRQSQEPDRSYLLANARRPSMTAPSAWVVRFLEFVCRMRSKHSITPTLSWII